MTVDMMTLDGVCALTCDKCINDIPCEKCKLFIEYDAGGLEREAIRRDVEYERNYTPKIYVECGKCYSKLDEQKCKFVDIEEGMMGEDIMTFICPLCGCESRSRRYG